MLSRIRELEKGSHILVKISAQGDFFEASANVVYSQPGTGTALVFRSIQPHFAAVLKKWLAGLGGLHCTQITIVNTAP